MSSQSGGYPCGLFLISSLEDIKTSVACSSSIVLRANPSHSGGLQADLSCLDVRCLTAGQGGLPCYWGSVSDKMSTNITVRIGGGSKSCLYTPPSDITKSVLAHLLLHLPPPLHTYPPVAMGDVHGRYPHMMDISAQLGCVLPPHFLVCPDMTGRRDVFCSWTWPFLLSLWWDVEVTHRLIHVDHLQCRLQGLQMRMRVRRRWISRSWWSGLGK